MSPRVPLLLILALTVVSAFAQTPQPDGVPQLKKPAPTPPPEGVPQPQIVLPTYLMPVSPHRPFEESVERLLGNRWGEATMIYSESPFFGNDFAVSVWGADDKPKTLTLIRFEPAGGRGGLTVAKTKSEINVPLDQDFVDAIHEAWSAMLLKTRYPPKLYATTGGWHAEFSAWVQYAGGVFGQDAPVNGFSKELMDFGFALRDYCRAKEKDRKAKRDAMIPRLKDFTERVKNSHLY